MLSAFQTTVWKDRWVSRGSLGAQDEPGESQEGPEMSEYGTTPPPGGMTVPPDNKMVWSVLVTLFCCLPFGIVAIIKSSEVNNKWAAGDVAGANASAAEASKWIKWSVITGIVGVVLAIIAYVLFFAALFAASSSSSSGM